MKAVISSETKWDEERYARDIADAEAVKADPKKMAMAIRGAKRLAKEQTEKARAMSKVAKVSRPMSSKKVSKNKKTKKGLDPFFD